MEASQRATGLMKGFLKRLPKISYTKVPQMPFATQRQASRIFAVSQFCARSTVCWPWFSSGQTSGLHGACNREAVRNKIRDAHSKHAIPRKIGSDTSKDVGNQGRLYSFVLLANWRCYFGCTIWFWRSPDIWFSELPIRDVVWNYY